MGIYGIFVCSFIAIACLKRTSPIGEDDNTQVKSGMFLRWYICCGMAAFFGVIFNHEAMYPGVILGVLLLSPAFGTVVLLAESGIARIGKLPNSKKAQQ